MSRTELKKFLIDKGIKPSLQRIKIMEYIMSHDGHPDIDDIYGGLIKFNPTLSKTTVYNSIKLFINKGIVRIVNMGLSKHRYEINTNLHGHFKCRKCGEIYDFNIEQITWEDKVNRNFIVEGVNGTVIGICNKCNERIISNDNAHVKEVK